MNNAPKFFVNLWGNLQGNLDSSKWSLVTQAWNEKRHQDAFYLLLDYINPALRNQYGDPSQTKFKVPHGSVVVDINLTGESVNIDCPLADISNATRIPLLRKVSELNFYPLTLAQIKLDADRLTFRYSTTLDTCEPFKIYYVLKEICVTADRYDDEFQEKFKAKYLVEPKVQYPSPENVDKAWDQVNEIINETFQYQVYFDSQRWYGSTLDFLMLALKRIDLCTQVQGFLKSELERMIGELGNNNLNINDRIQRGKTFLQQLQQAGKNAFGKNLYQSEIFIPEKWRTNGEQVKANVQNITTTVQKYHGDKNYIGSVIESLYCMYDLFYKNNMDDAVNNILIGSMTNASEKTWEESSAILLTGLQTITNTDFKANA